MAILYFIPFILVGLLMSGGAAIEWLRDVQLNQAGLIIQGIITSRRAVPNGLDNAYYVTYRFLPSTGGTYTHEQAVIHEVYDQLDDGVITDILYLTDDPNISSLPDEQTVHTMRDLLTLFGALWNITILSVLVGSLLRNRFH